MPHEVIMPALGVAQDTGLILAWLKQPGDAIKSGDALMEIETDKAVVEVEAQADGYLTNISAAAGDHVPVGEVVGLISETESGAIDVDADETRARESATQVRETENDVVETEAEKTHKQKLDTLEPEAQSANGIDQSADDIPEGEPIIMPALGMAQDTGLIVAWHKQPGDAVAASDILLEVETDKSVMEVEAQHDGFLAAILADAQQDVPVGSTIAIISSSKPDKAASRKRVESVAATAPEPVEKANTVVTKSATTDSAADANKSAVHKSASHNSASHNSASQSMSGERILASPKAKRLALEQGLDLERLASHGVPQPFHVADLETLKLLGRTEPDSAAAVPTDRQVTSTPVALHIEVRVPAQGDIDFTDWLTERKGLSVSANMLWLRYATAALRTARGLATDSVAVQLRQVRQAHQTDSCYIDADYSRVSKPLTNSDDQQPDLILRDFSASRITAITTAASSAPVLTIRREHDDYLVSLGYRTDHLDENVAIDFITDFSSRLGEPLRQLL